MTTELALRKPLYKLGQKVYFDDNYHANPGYKVLRIGIIQSIAIKRGKGMLVGENAIGEVTYWIAGFGTSIPEDKITPLRGTK